MQKSKEPIRHKVILDTSCLVAALLAEKGISAQTFASAVQGEIYNFYTSEMLEELRDVLARPKFELEKENQEKFINLFQEVSFLIQQHASYLVVQCRDQKDDKFLSLANQIDANFIITLDADLLVLGSIKRTKIIMPWEFLERMKETNRRI
mgnify:CR=1 FL=1